MNNNKGIIDETFTSVLYFINTIVKDITANKEDILNQYEYVREKIKTDTFSIANHNFLKHKYGLVIYIDLGYSTILRIFINNKTKDISASIWLTYFYVSLEDFKKGYFVEKDRICLRCRTEYEESILNSISDRKLANMYVALSKEVYSTDSIEGDLIDYADRIIPSIED